MVKILEKLSDPELINCLLKGNSDAAGIIIMRHAEGLAGFCYRLANGDKSLADDLAQETWCRALEKIDSFGKPYNFISWLYTIARNISIDHGRRQAMFKVHQNQIYSNSSDYRDQSYSIEMAERMVLFKHAIDDLPDTIRESFVAHHLLKLTAKETAKQYDISTREVYRRCQKGREILSGIFFSERFRINNIVIRDENR